MLIPFQYAYLIGSILFCMIWFVFYWHRKDLRKEMMIMSILVAILGLVPEYLWWTKDWWQPQTVAGTKVGIEDILLGFSTGGIGAVLYEEIFKKRLYKTKPTNHNLGILVIIFLFFAITLYAFYVLKFNSFIATSIALLISGSVLTLLRKDLFYDSLLTGLCLTIVTIPVFLILEYIFPGFIEKTWLWKYLSGIKFLGIPIEDLIFYFLSGFLLGPFYLYWKNEKLRKISK